MSWIEDIREGLQQLPQDDRALQHFAALMTTLLLLAAAWLFFIRRDAGTTLWFVLAILLLIALALLRPRLLRPLHTGWMALALTLGALVSRLLLTLFYYLVVTPIALILRLIGKDSLQRKIKKEGASYWIRRPEKEMKKEDYKRLF
jgi:hypothetical protein